MMHLAYAAPEQLAEVLKDPDPQAFERAADIDADRWWSYGAG